MAGRPTYKELEAEISRLTRELGLERIGKPDEQPLIDIPLDRQIVLLNREIKDLHAQLEAILARAKDPVIVRDCGGATNVIASLAVTVSKLSRRQDPT